MAAAGIFDVALLLVAMSNIAQWGVHFCGFEV
jgi:hypothetical protein